MTSLLRESLDKATLLFKIFFILIIHTSILNNITIINKNNFAIKNLNQHKVF